MNLIKQKKEKIDNTNKIEEFINKFKDEYSRMPTEDEIYNNLQEEINEKILNDYIESSLFTKDNVLNKITISN